VNVDTGEFRALRAEVAGLAAQVAEMARRDAINEAVIEAERARAVDEYRASRPPARRPKNHSSDAPRLRLVR
jgi:hypothetical protein